MHLHGNVVRVGVHVPHAARHANKPPRENMTLTVAAMRTRKSYRYLGGRSRDDSPGTLNEQLTDINTQRDPRGNRFLGGVA